MSVKNSKGSGVETAIWFDEYAIDVAFSRHCVQAETMRKLSGRLSAMSAATLRCARSRGEVDSDLNGTYGEALEAAEFVLRMSQTFGEVADKLQREVRA